MLVKVRNSETFVESYVILGKIMESLNEEVAPSPVVEKYYYIVEKTTNIVAIFMEEIRSKCVLTSYGRTKSLLTT